MANISRVVFGVRDPKAGAAGSLVNVLQDQRLNHQAQIVEGILAKECGVVLENFFQKLRSPCKTT